ncbi:ABC transporter permease [Paenibacillaceae bacterium WGS1546]|uniref:ABC transporter permease n=1 Tax=Cohnella sp. WGS1546 TaxID=3366810 RepID=UPI00372D4A91
MDVLNLLGNMLNITLVYSTALVLASLGGILSEKSGVENVGLEGLMTVGAFTAAVSVHYMQTHWQLAGTSLWIGVGAAVAAGALFSLIHAVATITFKSNQVISGIVINFLAAGSTLYLVKLLFDGSATTDTLSIVFSKVEIPFLSSIPFLGPALFSAYPTTYLALLLVGVVYFVLFKTPFGLRLRATGEHPGAVDTLGIPVFRIRYIAVMASGALAGLGGAAITLTTTSNFTYNTISGQGFIALAVMIFGKWNPIGAMGAAMFFGFSQAIGSILQIYSWADGIPREYIYMLPYVLTILVLVGVIGKARPPGAIGKIYDPAAR